MQRFGRHGLRFARRLGSDRCVTSSCLLPCAAEGPQPLQFRQPSSVGAALPSSKPRSALKTRTRLFL